MAEESVPQWKRDLIERRRALGRAASVGPLQFTCPGVVSAVRQPDLSPKGMHLPSVVPDIQQIISQIEADRKLNMGEEKAKKHTASAETGHSKRNKDDGNLSDSSEELKYGPGIVSKLKNKYLSLTLRESRAKSRPSLANLRRATSLENILDEPDKPQEVKPPQYIKSDTAIENNVAHTRRGLSRNKENMKRARSVETLMRYNRKIDTVASVNDDVQIIDVNEKTNNRASLEEKELPPPDLVKQTKKLFEVRNVTPPPPPMVKVPSIPKNMTPCAKPLISPKPTTLEKPFKFRTSLPNGSPESSILESTDKKGASYLPPKVDKPLSPLKIDTRPLNDVMSSSTKIDTTPKVEIVEKVESVKSLNEEKSVISLKMPDKVKKDLVDPVKSKTLTKDWSYVIKDRSPTTRESSPFSHDYNDAPTPKERSSRFLDRSIDSNNEVKDTPSPKPRLITKVSERRQMEPTSPVTEIIMSPVRTPTEINVTTNTSPMKQVGVIRPIVTQKVHNVTPPSFPSKHGTKNHTDRELEKNILNKVRSVEQPVTKVIVSLKKSPEECTVAAPKAVEEIKSTTWTQKPNTMVFNFSNRKNVPDYIENDGLILSSRKERPKVGDSGVIILQGGTDDSSTDFDVEDSVLGPPSPCDIVFIGDNVLINGKSSLQKTPKRTKLRIKFNDEAPMLFEYPSEASLLEDLHLEQSEASSSSPGLNVPLRSSPLASYTPSKVGVNTDFQLGVTRSQPPPPQKAHEENSSDEEGYLRPADDATTVPWSADTGETADMLY